MIIDSHTASLKTPILPEKSGTGPGFPVGGMGHRPCSGAPTPDVGTFKKNIFENERTGSRWGV